MKTIIHAYRFNLDTREGRQAGDGEAYRALVAKLTDMGLRCFNVLGQDCWPAEGRGRAAARKHRENIEARSGQAITLETAHIFYNQWNSAECGRVFDWYEAIYPNKNIKAGHWLEQTDEMVAVRRDTLKCGYCGKQEPVTAGLTFCPHCLDSEYLKPEGLHLTRLLPAGASFRTRRAPLTDEERAELMPRYHEAQGIGKTRRDQGRMSRARARIIEERDEAPRKAAQAVEDANIRAAGLLWLLDHGFDADNAIYYTHTRRFGLGWRTKLVSVPDCLTEFPYPYDLQMADGRKLSADR